MKQLYSNCITIIVIMLLYTTSAYYTSFTSDMAYNTIAYTSYPFEITPDKRTNKTHSNPFYTIESTVTLKTEQSQPVSVEIAVLSNTLYSYLGYNEKGTTMYCCTQFGIQNKYCKSVGRLAIQSDSGDVYATHYDKISNGQQLSVSLNIEDDEEYYVVVAFCGNDYSSTSYTRKDHLYSSSGELPNGYSPLLFIFPVLCIFYIAFFLYWRQALKAEKKKSYFKTIQLSLLLYSIEYLVLSIFIYLYQWTGNTTSFFIYFFSSIIYIIRGINRCCFLYLTLGHDIVKNPSSSIGWIICYGILFIVLSCCSPFFTLTVDLSMIQYILHYQKIDILLVVLFLIFFFILLKNSMDLLLDKNQFKNVNAFRKYRSAIIITSIVYLLACVAYLIYDYYDYIIYVQQKWILYQFLWDIVKCIAIILTARAWKSLYTPNRIQ